MAETIVRPKRLATIISVNVILILGGIILAEIVFGNWFNSNQSHKLNVPKSCQIKFDVAGLYPNEKGWITYTRDEKGLRGKYPSLKDINILTVGGSTTDQRYIDDENTWQRVMQDRLEEMGKSWVIANAGIDGQSTYGHIKNFDWWFSEMPELKPTYVLYYIGINDFCKDEGNGFDQITMDADRNNLKSILSNKSALYHSLITLRGMYRANVEQKIGHAAMDFKNLKWTSKSEQQDYDAIMATRLKEYTERLEMLIKRTKEWGASPVFVTQPTRRYRFANERLEGLEEKWPYDAYFINGVDYYHMLRKLDAVTQSVAMKHQIPCIDMGNEKDWENEDFYDDIHMTPSGASKLGHKIAMQLIPLLSQSNNVHQCRSALSTVQIFLNSKSKY